MKREERKRRFNEAIVNMLYPSPPHREPSPPDLEPLIQGSSPDVISGGSLDECENASTSGDEEDESGTAEKPTRAQRKKIRRKKLKEEAIRRGKLIGPLLPPIYEAAVNPPAVRSNASEQGSDESGGDELDHATSKKTKNRRKAKRLAKEKRIASASNKCSNDHASLSASSVDPERGPDVS